MFVKGGELDKGNFGVNALPAVKSDYDTMNGKEQVVIRLLEGLGDGVKLAFVRAAVVRLRLARHGADKVTMHPHSKAYHVDSFLYVGFPVAALLRVINLVDYNVVLLLTVGGNIESREPGFAAVLSAGEEVENLLFLGNDTRLLLTQVGNALGTKYRDGFTPVGVKDFGNTTVLVSRSETAITGFLSQQTHNPCAVLIENKHRYGETEVLDREADARLVRANS